MLLLAGYVQPVPFLAASYMTTVKLPAHDIVVTFGSLTTSNPTFNAVVKDFLIAYQNNTIARDLRSFEDQNLVKTVRFEYHPKPSITVSFTGSESLRTCATPNFAALKSMMQTQARVFFSEVFATEISDAMKRCDNIQGTAKVTNLLGESFADYGDEALSVCRPADKCEYGVVMDEGFEEVPLTLPNGTLTTTRVMRLRNAHVYVNLKIGYPNRLSPYTKQFTVSMQPSIGPASDPVTVNAVVLGLKLISDKSSVPFPEYMPLTVLHDPLEAAARHHWARPTAWLT
eukprot:m.510933 g.510933  ORF g.510933 m.510933 type:complete len:286 (-) comp57423_c1_seq3:2017-2874(-)